MQNTPVIIPEEKNTRKAENNFIWQNKGLRMVWQKEWSQRPIDTKYLN